MYSKDKVEIIE